MDTGAHSPDGA